MANHEPPSQPRTPRYAPYAPHAAAHRLRARGVAVLVASDERLATWPADAHANLVQEGDRWTVYVRPTTSREEDQALAFALLLILGEAQPQDGWTVANVDGVSWRGAQVYKLPGGALDPFDAVLRQGLAKADPRGLSDGY